MQALIIDPEFKRIIPPQTPEEHAGLEAMIVAEGCREPLITWGGILVDGHNRYEICTRLNIPFETREMFFECARDVRVWIRRNQLSRRNLTDAWRLELELDNKKDLLEVGKEKIAEAQAVRREKEKTEGLTLSFIDKDTTPKPATEDDAWAESPKPKAEEKDYSKYVYVPPPVEKHNTQKAIADSVGFSTGKVAQAEYVKSKAPEVWEKAKAGELTIGGAYKEVKTIEKEEQREAKREEYHQKVQQLQEAKEQGEGIPIPTTPPTLVIADPPWRYDFSETKGREIENHYDTATVEEICGHAPKTADDCVLLLWATAPKLLEAIAVMEAWGFKYKTSAVWDKEKIGMGYWFRGQHELLLVGTKGDVSPPNEFARVSSVFRETRGRHSAKPDCVYEWVEKAFLDEVKLEMYCRSPRPGWAVWGNEI